MKKKRKRDKKEKEKHLQIIASVMLKKPLLAEDVLFFISYIAKRLKISTSQAKKDIEEVKRRRKEMSLIDIKEEFARKKMEYAFIKEQALKQKNLNAYLGAVNKEAEMLALEKYTIFNEVKEEETSSLEEKKELLFKKLFPKKEIEKEKSKELLINKENKTE